MTVAQVRQRGDRAARAGTRVLSLLAVPINAAVIQALGEGPRSLADLRRAAGSPPQTTMRGYLRRLAQAGVVERHRGGEFPGNVEYRLDDGGRDLVTVAAVVSAWLAASPEGPTAFGGTAAKSAIKALVEGWSTRMVRALAVRPLSLTELDSVIVPVSYPSLERRLGAMRLAGLVEPMPSRGRGTPYGVSDWLRRAVAPLAAAARWERRHLRAEAPPITNRDAEAAFLLTVPLLRLPADLSGPCRLAVRVGGGEQSALAGVVVSVREGRVEDCVTKLEGDVDAWALGTAAAWLSAVIERDASRLETGGDLRLATELAGGLHGTLFGLAP